MQTQAERCLVQNLIAAIKERESETGTVRILNIGAGESISIEEQLVVAGCKFVSDRIDIEASSVEHPNVGASWRCSVESMTPIGESAYPIATSNFVLEHVPKLDKAASEIFRVLQTGGLYITTVPNVSSPEFWIARHTPTWIHEKIRGEKTWKTHYAFKSIDDLIHIFSGAGLTTLDVRYFPAIEQYLHRFPVIGEIGMVTDKLLAAINNKRLLGNVCLVVGKS